ncbi:MULTISPECIES: TauD/TfdA family dioxygenase [unclassified Paraburkholderia]|uniref:TauD/TfdA family dioxygenase n=1 Tax=unclassified Paraburkholderia TaxID=2615204 RepID=UPI002AB04BBE|nr:MULTISPECIES: TauD/TfdA family dioxygenase [unclassified Paraburkholderia]
MLKKNSDHLELSWPDGEIFRFHWLWLRQACECSDCFNSYARQRYFDPSIYFSDADPEFVVEKGDVLSIIWKDGHVSEYQLDSLRRNSYSGKSTAPLGNKRITWARWPQDELPHSIHFKLNEALESDLVIHKALSSLFEFGLIVFKADENSVVDSTRICDRLGGLLDRSYFGDYFDIEAKDESTTDSVAFSTRELPLHTDVPYYSPPPEYQFLYGLEVNNLATSSKSGSTRFIDGLTTALEMKESNFEDFRILSEIPVVNRAAFPTADRIYENRTSIIKIGRDGEVERLMNNPSKMFFDDVGYDDMLPLFNAYKNFKERLSRSKNSYSHTWSTADMVVWDNRRIFHGREEFSAPGVKRFLRGGYFKEVELYSRARYLTKKFRADDMMKFPS